VRGRKPLRVAGDVEDPAFDLHWRARRAAGFRGPQAVAEPEPQQAAVAGLVPGSLDGGEELIRYDGDKLFALVHRFVCCCRCWSGCDSRTCEQRVGVHGTRGHSGSIDVL
jgi:hypothetical protein